MHELSIANNLLEAVQAEARNRPGVRFVRLGVRVGELTAVDPEALTFCFQVLVRGTAMETLELELERVPRRHRCQRCGWEFTVVDYDVTCPACGTLDTECIAGTELEFAYLEMEEP